jgi:hypothetical protein
MINAMKGWLKVMTTRCQVCADDQNMSTVAEMTDGRNRFLICDLCRELVTTLFYVHGSLTTAVSEATKAKQGV